MVRYRERSDADSLFSGINIVPFTDVVLVLLIIFMIAAPGLLSSGLNINLPGASVSDTSAPERVTVGLDRGGQMYLDARPITPAELKQEIAGLVQKRSDLGVVLNADEAAGYGKVVEILDVLRQAGARRIYVGTVQK